MNNEIINSLSIITATYQSIISFFYQKIIQKAFTNNQLAVYKINYSLLLPGSQFITTINEAQVNAQMQAYVNLCEALTILITTTVNTQTNLFYEQIQNILQNSIAQLNGFSVSLLNAQYLSLFKYEIPYNMGMTEALFLN